MNVRQQDSLLLYHPGALGDNVLTWPILAGLRQTYLEYHFIGVGNPDILSAAKQIGLIDHFIDQNALELLPFWAGNSLPDIFFPVKGALLWLNQPDPVVSLLKKHCTLPVVQISQKSNQTQHMTLYYWEKIKSHYPVPHPDLTANIKESPRNRLKYVLIHPGSGSPSKNYPVYFYREIASTLQQNTSNEIAFILGPAEIERGIEQNLQDFLCFKPQNIISLVKILQQASLFIGNDSGVSHLAGFLSIPTIAIYKTTDPGIWGVRGQYSKHVFAENSKSALAVISQFMQKYVNKS